MGVSAGLKAVGAIPVGVVSAYAGSAAPSGYLLCYGQAVSRTEYAALFAVTSTTYGVGDGSTTFNVPDLRGRAVAGIDNMGGTDAGRLSTSNTLGTTTGTETITLATADIPAHSHANTVTIAGGAHTHQVNGGSVYSAGGTGDSFARSNSVGDSNFRSAFEATTSGYGSTLTTHTHTATHTAANTGGGGSHNNMQPTMVLNYIIKATNF